MLRKKVLTDWLIALIKPLEEVNFNFNKFRKTSNYKVTHNGQVFSLQAVLNDSYDKILRRIKIVDSLIFEPLYIYPELDSKPVYVYDEADQYGATPYVYDGTSTAEAEVDFLVLIPKEYKPASEADRTTLEIQIKSLINYYKLASKRYLILWT